MVENWNDDDRAVGDYSSIVKSRSPVPVPYDFRKLLKEIALMEQEGMYSMNNSKTTWINYEYEWETWSNSQETTGATTDDESVESSPSPVPDDNKDEEINSCLMEINKFAYT